MLTKNREHLNKYENNSYVMKNKEPFQYYSLINLEDFKRFNGRIFLSNCDSSFVERWINENYFKIVLHNPEKDLINKKLAINSILVNILLALEEKKVVIISRRKNDYTIPKMYGLAHIKYIYIITFLDQLYKLKLIDQAKGFFNRETRESKTTRIWATYKLINELNNCINSKNIIQSAYQIMPFKTPIILKDKKKNLISYIAPKEIRDEEYFLNVYNDLLKSYEIKYTNGERRPPSLFSKNNTTNTNTITGTNPYKSINNNNLYRVYNYSSFQLGGRFYGAEYQRINKQERATIEFNNKKTIELDFKSLHLTMLYNLEGHQLLDDPYSIVGLQYREIMKKIALISINAGSLTKGFQAFNRELQKDFELYLLKKQSGFTTPELFKKFSEAHPKISKYLNSGIGLKLQNKDAHLASNIMKNFVIEDVLIATVHDSFIIEEKYKDDLKKVMKEEYRKLFGYEITVK
ncbi:MAG: hypothetical protein H6609_20705 [Ignavibacteriales bacterium]|nr:hypothetical protein [Ignavibacteriales bacterium]